MELVTESQPPGTSGPGAWRWASLAALLAFAIYQLNGDLLPGNDSKPNVFQAVSLWREGNLSFTPQEMPFMFVWARITDQGLEPVTITDLNQLIDGVSARARWENDELRLLRPKYYLVPTRRSNEFVSIKGLAPGLILFPALVVADAIQPGPIWDSEQIWWVAKLMASLCVAASVCAVGLYAFQITRVSVALIVTTVYALGTCVWSSSSQALWQTGPALMFLTWGLYWGRQHRRGRVYSALCGACLGAAVVTRPTCAAIVVSVLVYWLIQNRKQLPAYILGGLPFAIVISVFNTYYFGRPWITAQTIGGQAIAEQYTGSPRLWQTSVAEGLVSILFSPSRGLFVYSPILLLALGGVVLVWRDRRCPILQAASVGAGLIVVVVAQYFNWWGGWSFGYRYLIDITPILCWLLIPAIERALEDRVHQVSVGLLISFSIAVQVIGAFAYNVQGWNSRLAWIPAASRNERDYHFLAQIPSESEREELNRSGSIVRLNVDEPRFQHRLWSLRDSQLVYYITHFKQARREKREGFKRWIAAPER